MRGPGGCRAGPRVRVTHGVVDWSGEGYWGTMEPLVLTADEVADGESWEDVRLVDTALPGIDARALGFSDAAFAGADLSSSKLQNLFLIDCFFQTCNLANATVRNGSMRRVTFDGCRLTGFTWTAGEAHESTLQDCPAGMGSFEAHRFRR